MKRQVRRSVFETNSSSTHSLSITNGNLHESNLYVDDFDNKVHVEFGEFGWEVKSYTDQYTKLQYLVTMLATTEGGGLTDIEDFFETNGFKKINELIKSYCNCDGIVIDSEIKIDSYEWNGNVEYYLDFDGYIDHQSCECYHNIDEFLDYYNTDIINFIFNNGVVLHTDNDNY